LTRIEFDRPRLVEAGPNRFALQSFVRRDHKEEERMQFIESIRGCRTLVLLAAVVALWSGASWAEEAEEEDEGWTGELSASGAVQTGTVDTISGTLDSKLERDWEKDYLGFRLTGSYGRNRDRQDSPSENTTTENAQAFVTQWKHIYRPRFFQNSRQELSRDTTQNREVRVWLTTGPGYRLWQGEKPKKEHFDVTVGAGYRYELYDGNTGDPTDDGYDRQLGDVLATFEYKNNLFEDRIEYTHTGAAAMPVNETKAYVLRSEVIIGVPLTAAWSFRTTFLIEYTNDVPDDVNSTLTRTTMGIGYKF
jgi:putative salt-induced outer membrane protein YdiY